MLAPGVSFEALPSTDSQWIVMLEGVPRSRVSSAVITLLSELNGRSTLREVRARIAPGEQDDAFLALVDRFRQNGLLAGANRKNAGRFAFRAPFTVQFATLRAPVMFDRLDRIVRPFPGRTELFALGSVAILGMVATIVQAPDAMRILVAPVPLLGLGVMLIALSFLTLIHESAHGLTLARLGGSPRRAGFMIFYLTPAFFVDVTDGWRLRHRWHRVSVALAGPAVHAIFGSIFAIAALLMSSTGVRDLMLLLAVACYGMVLVNLVPFVRFDGYIALMSALDEPNLRERTKHDASQWVAHLLYGSPVAPKRLDRWWSIPFGVASILTPVCLVVFAVARMATSLAGGGPLLGLVVLVIEATVLLVGGVMLVRGLRTVWRAKASFWRFSVVNIALVSLVALAGSMVAVPVTATAGFAPGEHDSVVLVSADGEGVDIPTGATVSLMTNGLMGSRLVGSGTFEPHPPQRVNVPLQALFPVTMDGVDVPATALGTVRIVSGSSQLPSSGQARIELATMSLWQWLWTVTAQRPLADLLAR